MKKTTIKDIAAECGISIGTVDRIIHQRGRYSKETEALVLDAMKRLNYVPKHASSIPQKKDLTIGVYYPVDSIPEDFWNTATIGIDWGQDLLNLLGIQLVRVVGTSFNTKDQILGIQKLLDQNVDAIVTTSFDSSTEYCFGDYIPDEIPYATVCCRSWKSNALFHFGPNDEIMGKQLAKLITLYSKPDANVAIIAPNMETDNTQKRLTGFINISKNELTQLSITKIIPVLANTPESAYKDVYKETLTLLQENQNIDAIYVTNGFFQPACEAIRDSNNIGKTKVFAHELCQNIQQYLADETLACTLYQDGIRQWSDALSLMARYLLTDCQVKPYYNVTPSLITKESYPLFSIL